VTVQWEKVYVFISSTFNDMHAERDYLVKQVFPRLQEWCERRKLRLVDIDLRWGVTEADASENKRVVQVCLERIDACRPFFLCFLGQRRGWVPGRDDISAETYAGYPGLERYAGDASVTELEVLHAYVNPLQSVGQARAEHSFFYLREPDCLDDLPGDGPGLRAVYTNEGSAEPAQEDAELRRWREVEIPRTGRPAHTYTAEWDAGASTPEIRLAMECPSTAERGSAAWEAALRRWSVQWAQAGVRVDTDGEIAGPIEREKAEQYNARLTRGRLARFTSDGRPLADAILADLQAAIAARYPEHVEGAALTPLQRELDQQAHFLEAAGEGFIEREGDFAGLDGYAKDTARETFFLTAPGGLGKTSLLARWIDRARDGLKAGESLHYRFIGASDASTTVDALLRSLLAEIKEVAGKVEDEVPVEPDKLRAALPRLLQAAGARGKTVLVLDGLNQLESGLGDLGWLPPVLPAGVKLVASFKRGEEQAEAYYERLQAGGQALMAEVRPFASLEDRRRLVRAYLSQFLKELDERHLEALIRSEGAGNPLYLKVVLAELRVFGVFGDLGTKIRGDFGSTPVEAFSGSLRRLEGDPAYSPVRPEQLAPRVFGWLAHARTGLTAEELCALLLREGLLPGDEAGRERASEAVHGLLRQVRPYLSRREGRIDFFYESFEQAARERYVRVDGQKGAHPESRTAREWHTSLAAYFEEQPLRLGAGQVPNLRKLSEQAHQQAHAGLADALTATLTEFDFLYERVAHGGPQGALEDYDLIALPTLSGTEKMQRSGPGLRLIRDALRLSAPVSARHPALLPGQLVGRLAGEGHAEIQALMAGARAWRCAPWLQPLTASLAPAGGPLVFTLTGHSYHVNGVAVTSDGALCVSAGADWSMRVWDMNTGVQVHQLGGHGLTGMSGGITSVAITPDNRYVLAGARSATKGSLLALWDIGSGSMVRDFGGHGEDVITAVVVPGGRRAVSGSTDGTILVWDLQSGARLGAIRAEPMTTLVLSPDGKYAVSVAHSDGRNGPLVSVFDLAGRSIAFTFRLLWAPQRKTSSPDGPRMITLASVIAFTPDGTRLVAADEGGLIRAWDVASGTELLRLEGHSGQVDALAFHPDGGRLFSGSTDACIRVWDLDSGRCLATLEGHSAGVKALRVTADGEYLLSGSADKTLRVWALDGEGCRGTLAGHTGAITAIALTPDQRFAISCSEDGSLKVWDWRLAGQGETSAVASHVSGVTSVALSPDGRWGISAAGEGELLLWEMASGKSHTGIRAPAEVRALSFAREPGKVWAFCKDGAFLELDLAARSLSALGRTAPAGFAALAESPSGIRLFCSQEGKIRALDPVSGRQVAELEPGAELRMLWGLAATPEGGRVAAVYWTGVVDVWDGRSGRRLHSLRTPSPGLSVALGTGGGDAVAGLNNGNLYHWNLLSGGRVASWRGSEGQGSTNWIRALARAAAAPLAVSGANDGTIRLWDLGSHSLVAQFQGESQVNRCAIAADGRTLIAGEESGRVHILRLVGLGR